MLMRAPSTLMPIRYPSTLDCIDFFCGIGGSSSGLVRAGWTVRLAANHDQTSIATHSANHPNTEHLCADLQTIDFRFLPRTRALWASPICTELSPGGGKKKKQQGPSLWEEHGHVPDAAFERTRVTFWEVLRAAEVWPYEVIMLENVVEAFDWVLLPVFLSGLETLGYEIQTVCVSAAHIGGEGNPHAPQLRDRIYWIARRRGIPAFDFTPRPPAWCDECGAVVEAVQWWKPPKKQTVRSWKGQRAGKYNGQYLYVCPIGNHGRVEPLVMPAAQAIDWANLGERIGDRKRSLANSTMLRIGMGIDMIANPATTTAAQRTPSGTFVMAVNHDGGPRAFDPTHRPLPTRSTKNGEALVAMEPFVTMLRKHGRPTRVSEPLKAIAAGGYHHGLTVPPGAFISKHHGGWATGDPSMNRPVTDPLPTMRAHSTHSLVVPFRRGSRPHDPSLPFSTMATHTQHGVMTAQERVAIEDCYFRMLTPREGANAQRFEPDYRLTGNLGEQQMGVGNAVAVNVSQWIGSRVAEGLDVAA